MKTIACLAALGLAATALTACVREDAPRDSAVAEAMPDTSAPRSGDAMMTAPDAGVTGAVPADGSPPPVAQTPAMGTAGGAMSQPQQGEAGATVQSPAASQ